MSRDRRGHALVIGGSLAGLCCAEVLSRHFDRVTIVERDVLPQGPGGRRGVPQDVHLHFLLARGQHLLETIFPGLSTQIAGKGTTPLDVAEELAWLTPQGWAPRFRSNITILPCSRRLLESTVRERLRANPRVELREGLQTVGLLHRNGVVAGIRARPSGRRDLAGDPIPADLVADTGGRGSRLPHWLEELGCDVPPATVVDAKVTYTTLIHEGRPSLPEGIRGVVIQAAPPGSTRGGVLLPIEGTRTLVTLVGRGGEVPSGDEGGVRTFARSLRSPLIHDALAALEPVTPPVSSRATDNRRRPYELMREWPSGLVVLGDAASAFNPLYGQGMTVAAQGVVALDRLLAEAGPAGACSRTVTFQRRLARLSADAWRFATDLDLPACAASGGGGERAAAIRRAYLAHVGRLAVEQAEVRLAVLEVAHMLRRPRSLLRPRILLPLAGRAARGPFRRRPALEGRPPNAGHRASA